MYLESYLYLAYKCNYKVIIIYKSYKSLNPAISALYLCVNLSSFVLLPSEKWYYVKISD